MKRACIKLNATTDEQNASSPFNFDRISTVEYKSLHRTMGAAISVFFKALTINHSNPIIITLFLLCLMVAPATAGDVSIGRLILPSKIALVDVPTPMVVKLKNGEAFPVAQFSITFQVRNYLDEIKFNVSYSNITVAANSTLQCSTYPDMWTPTDTGMYKLFITSTSPNDIDLSNNNAQIEFRVMEKPIVWLEQLNLYHPFQLNHSRNFSLGVDVPASDELLWLNVLARKPLTTGEHWIVRNMPLLPFDADRKIYYPWYSQGLEYEAGEEVTQLEISLSLSYRTKSSPFLTYSFEQYEVKPVDYNIGFGIEEEMETGTVPSVVTEPVNNRNDTVFYHYRGCNVPNIDLDSSKYKPTELSRGDWNACGPASAANSLEWLEAQHPGKLFSIFGHREKMTVLDQFMERENEAGVTTKQLVRGKLGFIDLADLSIHVKYQSWFENDSILTSPDSLSGHFARNMSDSVGKNHPPTWEFLKEEMEKGEDVEILFGWYDSTANRHGGHWVTVTGIVETDTMKGIFVKDDWDQAKEGGTRELFLRWHEEKPWARLVGYDGPNNYCWVESVVSESYDSTVTHNGHTAIDQVVYPGAAGLHFATLLSNPIASGDDIKINLVLAEQDVPMIEIVHITGTLIFRSMTVNYPEGSHAVTIPGNLIIKPGHYLVKVSAKAGKSTLKLLIH